jgi:hypothetical protein
MCGNTTTLRVDAQASTSDSPDAQSIDECVTVDHVPSGRVYRVRVRLHRASASAIDEVTSLGGRRAVEAHKVCPSKQIFERNSLGFELLDDIGRGWRSVRSENTHAEACRAFRASAMPILRMPTMPRVFPVTCVAGMCVGRHPRHSRCRTWRSPSPVRRALMRALLRRAINATVPSRSTDPRNVVACS